MGWLDSAISAISPRWAFRRDEYRIKREIMQSRISRKRSFDAVSGGRSRTDMPWTSQSADAVVNGGAKELRQHIRQLEYNNGFIAGPIKRIVNNVVGPGIRFQSRVKSDNTYFSPAKTTLKISEKMAEDFNGRAERGFKYWAKQADVRLLMNFAKIQRLAQACLERDGEALIIGRESENRNRRFLPYCLEFLEIDRLQTPLDEQHNPKVKGGIRFDSEGVPESYYLLKQHPGDTYMAAIHRAQDFEEVPAYNKNGTKKVFHLFDIWRPEQSRGYSPMAAGLKDFQDLDRYREAEILAALEDACLTGIVTTSAPDDWQAGMTTGNTTGTDGDGSTQRIHEFGVNQWLYMQPGENVSIHSPSRPNDQLDSLVNHILRGPANALDIPPEVLAQNWAGMNYSNARTVLLQFFLSMRVRQSYLRDFFLVPTYENVLPWLVWKGFMGEDGARLYNQRKDDVLDHTWIAPGWQWVDPLKESQGKSNDVENCFDTLTNVNASQGYDIDETLETRARELKKIKDLEERYEVTFSKTNPSPVAANPEEDDEEGGRNLRVL